MTYPILPVGSTVPYTITNSVRLNQGATKRFTRTFVTPTNATTWTFSFWFRWGLFKIGATDLTAYIFGTDVNNGVLFGGNNTHYLRAILGGTTVISGSTTTGLLQDQGGWYHIVFSTSGGNSHNIWVNGVLYATSTTAYTGGTVNTAIGHSIGAYTASSTQQADGLYADIYFVDGQALTASNFGTTDQTTGKWIPVQFNGPYGNNGFFLKFADGSASTATTIGKDSSPNGNNWTPTSITVAGTAQTQDWTTETPTPYGTRGRFGIMSALLARQSATSYPQQGGRTAGTGCGIFFPVTTGKWYFEFQQLASATPTSIGGVNTRTKTTTTGSVNTIAQTYGVRYDSATGVLEYTTNGTAWTAIPSGPIPVNNGPVLLYMTDGTGGTYLNPGWITFSYAVPTGYNPICDVYLTQPTGVLAKPLNTHNLTTYTGTGATQTVSNLVTIGSGSYSFQPDIVFIASNNTALDKPYYDASRGVQAQLLWNTSAAETTVAAGLTAFNTNGFTIGTDTRVNTNGTSYSAAQIAIGGSPVTNTSGTITSSVQANQTTGVSIVTWTGTGVAGTIGHGLSSAPTCMIIKIRSTTGVGNMYHRWLNNGTNPWGSILDMSTTANEAADTTYLNNTAPTSSVFSVGVSAKTNTAGATYVAYCFTDIDGYSATGSYTGNATLNLGNLGYTGGKPRWAIVKQRTGTNLDGWYLVNFAANRNNILSVTRLANSATAAVVELIPNSLGFSVMMASGASVPMNANTTGTYIFLAFNESPFVTSTGK